MQAIPRGETQHTGRCSLEGVTIRSVPQQSENRCCNIVYWYVNSLCQGCTKRWQLMKQEFLEEFADFCSSLAQAVIMLLARMQIHKKNHTRQWFFSANAFFCVKISYFFLANKCFCWWNTQIHIRKWPEILLCVCKILFVAQINIPCDK